VLRERAASWYHGVSPPSHQARLDSLVAALKKLADRGLTAGCVLANLHHRRVVFFMERPLRIFEMSEVTDSSPWRDRGCCETPSRGCLQPPGRDAPSTSGLDAATTWPCGRSRCCPLANW
jgi:hypothetical protein